LADNVYEGMFILDSGRYGQDPEAVSGRISTMIQGAGGEMLVSRLWEERRLAYPIKGHRRGTYWLTYFRLDSNRLAAIRRQCQLNENILRKLFLRVDPRIVDALVAHAQTATPSSSSKGGGEEEGEPPRPDSDRKRRREATVGEEEDAGPPEDDD
jgi:small subunit ribosomal protein S6